MPTKQVDYGALHKSLDTKRRLRNLSWRQVAAEIDVPPGTFSRLLHDRGCTNHAFVSILDWLGAADAILPFVKRDTEGTR
jgi:hypothetical protein